MSYERGQQDSEAQRNTRGDLQWPQAQERSRQTRQNGNYDLNAVIQPFSPHPYYPTGQFSAASPFTFHQNLAGGYIQPLVSWPQGFGPAPHEVWPNTGTQANDNGQLQDARRVIPVTAFPYGLPGAGMWSGSLTELNTPPPLPPQLQRPQQATYRGYGANLTGPWNLERQQDWMTNTAHQQPQPLQGGPQADLNATRGQDSVIGPAPRASTNDGRGEQPPEHFTTLTWKIRKAISESPTGSLTIDEIHNVLQAKYPELAQESGRKPLRSKISCILLKNINFRNPDFQRRGMVCGQWLYEIVPMPVTVQTPPHQNPSQAGQSNETTVDDPDLDASGDTVDEDSNAEETYEHVRTTGGTPETQAATRESSGVLSDQKSGAGANAMRAKKRTSSPSSYFEGRQGPSQQAKEKQLAAATKRQKREPRLEGAKERWKTTRAEWKKRYKKNQQETRREREELEREQGSLFKLPRRPSNGEGA